MSKINASKSRKKKAKKAKLQVKLGLDHAKQGTSRTVHEEKAEQNIVPHDESSDSVQVVTIVQQPATLHDGFNVLPEPKDNNGNGTITID